VIGSLALQTGEGDTVKPYQASTELDCKTSRTLNEASNHLYRTCAKRVSSGLRSS
jgi:hypothetical protein